jgi:hypothetical protein
MVIEERFFQHPNQASRVRLAVYQTPKDASPVEGLPDEAGFLVIEERRGASKVVKTLGFFEERADAAQALQRRGETLERQRYRKAAPAA